jgi:peptidoglycan/xylan/chitin deacetylase (PgdA/CDA1 family)
MRIARRGVLGLGLAGLAGCAAAPSMVESPSPAESVPPSAAPSPSASASPSPEHTSPSPSPSGPPPLPSRDDIVARYSDRTPAQWGLEVDGVVLRSEAQPAVVTLDACGGRNGSGYDEALIQVLRRLEVPATLFLNLRWIDANPGIARELADDPLFELANHGTAHKPLSVSGAEAYGIPGTASVGEVFDEVMGGHARLTELTGAPPLWFRSGTAHVDDVAVEIVAELGQRVVNFDVNADAGATFTPAQVRQSMAAAGAGSICIGHFNRPGSGTADGMAEALPRLLDGGLTFARLRDILPMGA